MKIHILTLTWNGVNKIERLSQNLSPALTAITHANGKLKDGFDISTWYIKDNGSKDNTVEMMRNYSDRIDKDQLKTEIFEIGHNLDNFAQGMNYLFKQANPKDEDIVLLLNNDVIIDDTSSFKYMF
ncbi:MAG TPA: hypothetical protein VJ201_03490, partial [Candidatus Babeliales bacterium]|nr:hypothetical protein [Candidatus Babeliales bacterium]